MAYLSSTHVIFRTKKAKTKPRIVKLGQKKKKKKMKFLLPNPNRSDIKFPSRNLHEQTSNFRQKVKCEFTEKQPTLRILEASVQYKWDNYRLSGVSERCHFIIQPKNCKPGIFFKKKRYIHVLERTLVFSKYILV